MADGSVYYMYQKGAREKIKPKYNINQEEMNYIFSDLTTQKDPTLINQIYNFYLDPHIYDVFFQIMRYSLRNNTKEWQDKYLGEWLKNLEFEPNEFIEIQRNSETNKSKVLKFIIEKQFSIYQEINEEVNDFTIGWNSFKNFYFPEPYYQNISNSREKYLDIYQDGFILETLFDIKGVFYLIHPKENKIIRNCNGEIIKYKFNNIEKRIKELNKDAFKQMLIKLKLNYNCKT